MEITKIHLRVNLKVHCVIFSILWNKNAVNQTDKLSVFTVSNQRMNLDEERYSFHYINLAKHY